MKLGELLDTLAALDAAREDVDPPMTLKQWRDLDIVVRGADVNDNNFCGALVGADIEVGCSDGKEYLVLDASNEQAERRKAIRRGKRGVPTDRLASKRVSPGRRR